MNKLKAGVVSCILVLLATAFMGMIYISNIKSYSYVVDEDVVKSIMINNIKVLKNIDSTRVDGPNIIDNDIELDIDLEPYEVYTFKYDMVNNTNVDYELTKFIISCLNDTEANNYLSISANYEDGTLINNYDILPKGTKRTVYISIAYDKNVDDLQSFLLKFDMAFNYK